VVPIKLAVVVVAAVGQRALRVWAQQVQLGQQGQLSCQQQQQLQGALRVLGLQAQLPRQQQQHQQVVVQLHLHPGLWRQCPTRALLSMQLVGQ
jgi:hypothetical protein